MLSLRLTIIGTPHRGWQTLNGAMYYTRASPPQTNVPPLLELPPLPSVAPYAPYADHFAHLSDRSIIWGNGPRGPVQYGMSVNQAMNPYKAPAADFEGQGDKLREGSMPVSLGGPDQALPVAMKHMLKEGDDIGSNDQRSNSWQRDSTETSGSPEKTLDDLFKEQHELMDHLKLLTSKLKYAIRCSSWDPDHKAESDFLQGLAWKFSEVCNCNSYNILTVFAALPSKLRKNAVNRQSAVLGIPRETILALKVVHENLTRHDCRDSTDEYLQLEKAILELIKSSNKSKEALVSGKVARSPAKQKTNTGLSNRGLSDVRKSERDLIEKHFPPEVDLPVEALTVVLTQSTGFPGLNFPKFCEDYGYLHNLDNLVKILEENTDLTYTKTQSDSGIETDSNTYDENEEQEVTINGGFMWMHVPGNDRSWVKVQTLISDDMGTAN